MTGYLLLDNLTDYYLFPLSPSGFAAPALRRIPAETFHRLLDCIPPSESPLTVGLPKEALFIRRHDAYVKVSYDEILWLEASRSYCILHFADGHEWTVCYPLAEVARRFPATTFLRIHRSFLVNLRRIDAFAGNQLLVGGRYLPIGQQYKDRILAHFDFLKSETRDPDDASGARENGF